jgi:hypothetical protein
MAYFRTNSMLTRREILIELRRLGVKDLFLIKQDCRNFEKYWAGNYDYEIPLKRKHRPLINKQVVPSNGTMGRV